NCDILADNVMICEEHKDKLAEADQMCLKIVHELRGENAALKLELEKVKLEIEELKIKEDNHNQGQSINEKEGDVSKEIASHFLQIKKELNENINSKFNELTKLWNERLEYQEKPASKLQRSYSEVVIIQSKSKQDPDETIRLLKQQIKPEE